MSKTKEKFMELVQEQHDQFTCWFNKLTIDEYYEYLENRNVWEQEFCFDEPKNEIEYAGEEV